MDIFVTIMMAETFALVVVIALVLMVFTMAKPVLLPYLKAVIKKKDIVILVDHSNKIKFIPAIYSTGLFTISKPPWTFLQKLPKAYQLGQVRCVLVSDKWGVVADPDAIEALTQLNRLGYKDYETLERGIALFKKTNGEQGIDPTSWVVTRAFHEIRLEDVMQYMTEVTPSAVRAHIEENVGEIAAEYAKKMRAVMGKKSEMNVTLIIMIIIIIVLIIGGLVLSGGMGSIKLPGL